MTFQELSNRLDKYLILMKKIEVLEKTDCLVAISLNGYALVEYMNIVEAIQAYRWPWTVMMIALWANSKIKKFFGFVNTKYESALDEVVELYYSKSQKDSN